MLGIRKRRLRVLGVKIGRMNGAWRTLGMWDLCVKVSVALCVA